MPKIEIDISEQDLITLQSLGILREHRGHIYGGYQGQYKIFGKQGASGYGGGDSSLHAAACKERADAIVNVVNAIIEEQLKE